MAYDDNGDDRFDERDFDRFTSLFERYVISTSYLTLPRLIRLTQALHTIIGGRGVDKLKLQGLRDGLSQHGFGAVPFNIVMHLAEKVGYVSPREDVLSKITLKDLHQLATPAS